MKIFDVIILIILMIIGLSLIDRWYFRKIIIKDRIKIDSERHLLKTKNIVLFGLIRAGCEYIEYKGQFYMKLRENEISTNETEPRIINKALLRYNLEMNLPSNN